MVDGLLKNKVSSFHLFSSFPITEHAVRQGQQLWRLFLPTQSGRWQRLPFFSVLLARLQETMIGDRNKKVHVKTIPLFRAQELCVKVEVDVLGSRP